jgi:hypothetical protein
MSDCFETLRFAEITARKKSNACYRSTQVCFVEDCSGEVSPAEIRPAEVCPTEAHQTEICSDDTRLAEVRAAQIRIAEVRSAEIRAAKICSAEEYLDEMRTTEVRQKFGVRFSPFIPGFNAFSYDLKLAFVGHSVTFSLTF